MKTLTVRLPDELVAEIEAECRARRLSKSDLIRQRLTNRARSNDRSLSPLAAIQDLIGSVDGLPPDLSTRTKQYLSGARYGQKRTRRQ